MTREEAINAVGLELVEEAERDSCDFTNRVTPSLPDVQARAKKASVCVRTIISRTKLWSA